MTGLQILGVFLVLWGLATAGVAITQPEKLWKIDKIQSLVRSFGDQGTRLFMGFWASAAVLGGAWLLVS